ncbi:hypothetical protein TD95_000040 [Thielaviopsis punctulata]|uniref:Aldehyde dehydrogenase domain-containing protein n=1 Tax=Thielaviopsis punctulata TaxID=72032 RepID=A0A0F4Z6T7_9PEZI|nr:hypothetical protein TD95_000040 [Thielaviopsis punctulata]
MLDVAATDSTVPLVINGLPTVSATTFTVTSPETQEPVHQCSIASEVDAVAAVDAAAAAFPAWKATTPAVRRDIFLKTAEVMERRSSEIIAYMMAETGATQAWAGLNVKIAVDMVRDVAGRISGIEGMIPGTASAAVGAMVLKEPLGVILAIAPWNAPIILGTRAVAYPMAAGNTAVFKVSELSPRTQWAIVSCFHEAGLPSGVLNMVVSPPSAAAVITNAIIAHPAIKKLNFTGSTAVGRIIGRMAGEHVKPALLELGGKAPAIVWADADLDIAAAQCALGAFLNSGQICMSTERIIVHRTIRAAFEEKLAAAVAQFFPTTGDAPVLISAAGVAKNKALLADALAKGARVLVGEPAETEVSPTRMRPVVLGDVTPEMDIYKTESFGPTVSVFTVDSEEEALKLANDSEYGLTSAVFTRDLRLGMRFARGIETGAVHINSMTVHDESTLPHGGAKYSGYGRFNSTTGLDEWLRTKNITFDI